MIDLNHKSDYAPFRKINITTNVSDRINEIIDEALLKRHRSQSRRNYLGASALGQPCERSLFYDWFDVEYDEDRQPDGRMVRYFDAGHVFEDLVVKWFIESGFDLRTRDSKGQQFGFVTAQGRIAGHIDGVILSGPLELPYPIGFESKALNSKSWQDTKKRGVKISKPVYSGQMSLYSAYLDLDNFLFVALNKDTQELLHEVFPFDETEAQKLSDKGVLLLKAIDARQPPPRIAANRDFYICRMCRRQNFCWERDQ